MELNNINNKGNWGSTAASLNDNFAKVNAEVEKVKSSTVRFKGFFTSFAGLSSACPAPGVGDTAWVGDTYPGMVYDCKSAGVWANTNKAPVTPSVELTDYAKTELLDKRTTEYNVSVQHPSSGIDGTNKFTLALAIALVPSPLRTVGIKCSFLNDAGKMETWEYQGGTFTATSRWVQGGAQKVAELEQLLVSNEAEVVDFQVIEGFFWNGSTAASHTGWKYTSKIPVSLGDLVLVKARGGEVARLIFYYGEDGSLLFKSDPLVNTCCTYANKDGHIICNSELNTAFEIYKISSNSVLKQITSILNISSNKFSDYLGIVNSIPKLDTGTGTISFPAGSRFFGGGIDFTISEEINISRLAGIPLYSSSFVIINTNGKLRVVSGNSLPVLKPNEGVVAMVRWNECIFQGNFSEYYLNDNLIPFKPKRDYRNLIRTSVSELEQGFFRVSDYKVGDTVSNKLPMIYDGSWRAKYLLATKGSLLKIAGIGSSASGRLYMIVDRETKAVTHIAKPGENTLDSPEIIKFTKDCDVYISLYKSNLGYVEYETSILDIIGRIPTRDFGAEIDDLISLYATDMSIGYYRVSQYKVGDIVPNNLPLIPHPTHYSYRFIATKGMRFIVRGSGGSGESRLYTFVNNKTRVITAQASEGLDTTADPLEFYMTEETEIHVTFNKSTSLIKYYKKSFESESTTILNVAAPCMYNPILNLQKTQLRVLDIGNSYTDDATHHLPTIVTASGVDVSDMCLYKAVRGGASYKNWVDIYNDKDTTSYVVNKVTGGLTADISGIAAIGNGEKFRNTLANNEWDLIIIHQLSWHAPYYDRWEEDGDAGYLKELIRILRKHQPKATIGFLLVHSYWSGYSGNSEQSSFKRWELISGSAKKLRVNYGIDFMIPYGTAIQNLRASSLNNEYDLTIDGTHNASGLADYTAACTYFQALFAPRYGVNILGNTARWSNTGNETGAYPSSIVDVTDENAPIAQKAAFIATYDWYNCFNPENVDI